MIECGLMARINLHKNLNKVPIFFINLKLGSLHQLKNKELRLRSISTLTSKPHIKNISILRKKINNNVINSDHKKKKRRVKEQQIYRITKAMESQK